ncbi:MAG: hypothetical protein ABI761_18500 [Saprospiraceae bacterium]
MNSKQGTELITSQISCLLDQLDDASYTCSIPLFHGGTIGQHMRHILEFYICLFEGVHQTKIDYNSRKRNLVLSDQINAAKAVLEYIDTTVKNLYEHQGLQIVNEFSTETDEHRSEYFSSIGRELQYAFDHAVHHLAIIRMGIETALPHIDVDPDLGIAPSTLKYRKLNPVVDTPVFDLK